MYMFSRILILLIFVFNGVNADIFIGFDTQSIGTFTKPSSHQKIELDKIQSIAKRNNINVVFKALPWKRSLLMVEKGLLDGVIQSSYKNNRTKYAVYPMKNGKPDSSKRLNDGNSYYVYRNINTTLRWNGKKFVGSGTVAAMEKYAVIEDLEKHSNIEIKTFTNNSEILRKLASGQLDAYAGSAIVSDNLLKKLPSMAENIVRESLPIRKKDYFLIFSKITYENKSKEMNVLWDGLKEFNQKK